MSLMNQTSKTKSISGQSGLRNDQVTPESSPDDGTQNSEDSGDGEQVALSGAGLGDTAESFGRISMEDDQTNYVGSDHWAAILDTVSGLPGQDLSYVLVHQLIQTDRLPQRFVGSFQCSKGKGACSQHPSQP